MADDKKNKGNPDRYLISFKEKWEFDYAVKEIQREAPDATKKEAKEALMAAARKISPSEGRKKILKEALKKLQ